MTTELDETDSATTTPEPETTTPERDAGTPEPTESQPPRNRIGSVTVTVTQLLTVGLIVVLIAVASISTWMAVSARSDLNSERAQAADDQRAEQIALDYAVGAAEMNFKDTAAWRARLVANTLPTVAKKLTTAAGSIEQIIVPLQWQSTATPLAARVRDVTNDVLTVDTFVNVETKNMQAPDGMQSTATYVVKIDSSEGWKISDVGGLGAIAPK